MIILPNDIINWRVLLLREQFTTRLDTCKLGLRILTVDILGGRWGGERGRGEGGEGKGGEGGERGERGREGREGRGGGEKTGNKIRWFNTL